MDNMCKIHVYNFITREHEYEIDLKVFLSSISISQDSRTLLVLSADGHARLIDLETRETTRVFRSGEDKSQNVIKACFGGANESFVITGSESESITPIEVNIVNLKQAVLFTSGTRTTGP